MITQNNHRISATTLHNQMQMLSFILGNRNKINIMKFHTSFYLVTIKKNEIPILALFPYLYTTIYIKF
jgi:hypothetical protein